MVDTRENLTNQRIFFSGSQSFQYDDLLIGQSSVVVADRVK